MAPRTLEVVPAAPVVYVVTSETVMSSSKFEEAYVSGAGDYFGNGNGNRFEILYNGLATVADFPRNASTTT